MYADPSQIRKHRVTINLNDLEDAVVEAINNYKGGQKGALLREILLSGIHRLLHEQNYASGMNENEGAPIARFGS